MDGKQNVSVRLSEQNITDLGTVAKRVHLAPRTMMRQWILQRLEIELVTGDQDV